MKHTTQEDLDLIQRTLQKAHELVLQHVGTDPDEAVESTLALSLAVVLAQRSLVKTCAAERPDLLLRFNRLNAVLKGIVE